MSYESVQVVIELGHRSVFLGEAPPGGFTHKWTLFVCGARKNDISHFVEKVVFYLHDSFKSPKRVVKNPPYEVSESGYGSFECRIDVYFRNKGDPRKLTFTHDLLLSLDRKSDPVVVARCEKLTFRSPSEEFAQLLLRAGGVVLGETASPASNIARSKHTSSSDRKSSSHAAVPAGTSRSSTGAGKPSTSAAAVSTDQSAAAAVKTKNVCVVEPQSASKATAVVTPLVAGSQQFAKLFGEPIVKSDAPKRHHHKDKKKSSHSSSEKTSDAAAVNSQLQMSSASSSAAKDSVVSENTDSTDRQHLVQKRRLEASLFGDEESETPKKTKVREGEDSSQMKHKTKTEKNHHDTSDLKPSKQSTETNGNSRRSLSKTPEPTSTKHLDDSGKSSKDKHSKHGSDSHHHHSHSKHHKSARHSSSSTHPNNSSSTSSKQTTPPLSDGKSTATPSSAQQSAREDGALVPSSADDKRKISPLKLTKSPVSLSSSSAAVAAASTAQNHSLTQCVDMKKLFGDDDDIDDDDDDVDVDNVPAAAAAPVVVVKDDTHRNEDRHRPADVAKKHTSHTQKKTPEKSSSSHAHPSAAGKSRTDKLDTQPSKADSRSSSHTSNKHRRPESATEKKSEDATKSSGKSVTAATKPDSAPAITTDSTPMTVSDSATKSLQAASNKRKREDDRGVCEADLSLSDSDVNDGSEVDDVDVCDTPCEKPSAQQSRPHESDAAATSQLSKLSQGAKAANGEYISVLLDLQKRLMSVADDDALDKLTTIIEETGKYSITDDTFDFDLCRLDIQTVNKLKHFLATVA